MLSQYHNLGSWRYHYTYYKASAIGITGIRLYTDCILLLTLVVIQH